jgi:hypothetical protein
MLIFHKRQPKFISGKGFIDINKDVIKNETNTDDTGTINVATRQISDVVKARKLPLTDISQKILNDLLIKH